MSTAPASTGRDQPRSCRQAHPKATVTQSTAHDLAAQNLSVLPVQAHLRPDRSVYCRPAFVRIATEERCQLYFPMHGDQVVLLRSGLLVHLRKYMQVTLLPTAVCEILLPGLAEPILRLSQLSPVFPAQQAHQQCFNLQCLHRCLLYNKKVQGCTRDMPFLCMICQSSSCSGRGIISTHRERRVSRKIQWMHAPHLCRAARRRWAWSPRTPSLRLSQRRPRMPLSQMQPLMAMQLKVCAVSAMLWFLPPWS